MRKYSILLVCLLFAFVGNTSFAAIGKLQINNSMVKKYTDPSGNKYEMYANPAITVITPTSFSAYFFTNGLTTKQLIESYSCKAAINSTYFGRNDDGTFFPAGVRYKFGKYLRAPYQPAIDKNLRVLLSGSRSTIDFLDNDSFDFNRVGGRKDVRYANAGPWLVRDGKINPTIVSTLSHWQRPTTRAGILRNPDGKIKIILSTEDISLPQFIVFAYSAGMGSGNFQFVNIDGGSSTSLYTPYNSYQTNKRLPSFICIH